MSSVLANGNFTIQVYGIETDVAGVGGVTYGPPLSYTDLIPTGNSIGQGNCRLIVAGTVVSGTPSTIDLTNVTGAGITPTSLTAIKSMMLINNTGILGNDLTMGDPTGIVSNTFTSPWGTVTSGNDFVKSDSAGNNNQFPGISAHTNSSGFTVSSSHKYLIMTASNGTVTYNLDIIGTK